MSVSLAMRLMIVTLFATLALQGCQDEALNTAIYMPENGSSLVLRSELDAELDGLIQRYGLTGDPSRGKNLPSIDAPLAQLGLKLFFNKALSGDKDVACATCHHPLLGGGDNLSLSIGVGAENPDVLGHKRLLKDSLTLGVPRNAPTTFNSGLWQQFMFHDGRVAQVAGGITTPDVPHPQPDAQAGHNLVHAQARFPVTSSHEMRGNLFDRGGTTQTCRDRLAERLREEPHWLPLFRAAFAQADAAAETVMTEQNIAFALGEYERSQVFVNHAWKQYVQGDLTALSSSAKHGALLFFRERSEGGYACAACHRGDFFTDEQFRNVLMPPIGPGKGGADNLSQQDYGRWLVTQDPADKFRFRTPSLLNVAVTGPLGHNGAYTTLDGVVKHMLNPFQAALSYDSAQLQQPHIPHIHLQENLREMLASNTDMAGQAYREEDVGYLVDFLQTLTDPCVTRPECLSRWLPSKDSDGQNPLTLQLEARFEP